jgi:hypothetical protein
MKLFTIKSVKYVGEEILPFTSKVIARDDEEAKETFFKNVTYDGSTYSIHQVIGHREDVAQMLSHIEVNKV